MNLYPTPLYRPSNLTRPHTVSTPTLTYYFSPSCPSPKNPLHPTTMSDVLSHYYLTPPRPPFLNFSCPRNYHTNIYNNLNSQIYHCNPTYQTKSQLLLYPTMFQPCPQPGRIAQSVGHLTGKSGVLSSIPGLATYFRFFKKGSCQLLAKVCAA